MQGIQETRLMHQWQCHNYKAEIMGFRHYSGILLPSSLYASVLQLAVYLYSLHLTKQSLSQQNKINWPLRCAILLVHDCLL